MTRAHGAILPGLLLAGLAVVASGQPTGGGGFTELQRAELADAGGSEVVMGLVERPAGSPGAKHYHPGGEFGLVLRGSVTVATEQEPRSILNAGDSFHQPAGEWHTVSTTHEAAEAVVFRVLEKGQPMIVSVD